MRILAPFAQTYASQAPIPLLAWLAAVSRPDAEVTLLSVLHTPIGVVPERSTRDGVKVTSYTEVLPVPLPQLEFRSHELKPMAVQQALLQLHEYLLDIARRLPPGIRVNTEAHVSEWPRIAITDCARIRGADLIVMSTRSRPRASSLIFGSTTEAVVDSQVAPTLVVHPDDVKVPDQSSVKMLLTRRARIAMTRTWRL